MIGAHPGRATICIIPADASPLLPFPCLWMRCDTDHDRAHVHDPASSVKALTPMCPRPLPVREEAPYAATCSLISALTLPACSICTMWPAPSMISVLAPLAFAACVAGTT